MKRDALISRCEKYRYWLSRRWGDVEGRRCLFIMLNPSTADAEIDDPTIRRCISFAQREGCTSLAVVNLYAFRATDPRELNGLDFATAHGGETATQETLSAIGQADLVIAAWGADKSAPVAAQHLIKALAGTRSKAKLYCLGRTKSGAPRHPLYLSKNAQLTAWNYREYVATV